MTGSFSTHSIWSIIPWEVPWDLGHAFFLGLAYLVLVVLGVTLTVVSLRTKKDLENPQH
jgi:glucose uptake protein GlcU